MDVDVFTNEERILINRICENEKLSSLTRDTVAKSLLFSQQIAGDSDMEEFVEGTFKKVQSLTDDEWNKLKMLVPFPVAVIFEDEVSEIPADEELVV